MSQRRDSNLHDCSLPIASLCFLPQHDNQPGLISLLHWLSGCSNERPNQQHIIILQNPDISTILLLVVLRIERGKIA